MRRKFNFLLMLASLLAGLAQPQLMGQIVPLNVPSVPVDASDVPGAAANNQGQVQPEAYLRGWSFRNEVDQTGLSQGAEVSLDPGHPEIILFFDAAHRVDGKTEFRYRLNDYDVDWTVTLGHIAHYRRLTPGRYRFEVQARNPGQPWPGAEAVLLVASEAVLPTRPGMRICWLAWCCWHWRRSC